MIPKIIHYCWFGGKPLSKLTKKCIKSWKKYCPDYQIIEWNETNFDVNCNPYVKEAYQAKKWAFVSDVARLHALVSMGGIYMDTDVELLKPLNDFLSLEAFSGFESEDKIPTGLMASEKGQVLFQELLNDYNEASFYNEDGTLNLTTNVVRITNVCLKYGLILNNQKQTVNGFTLFPSEYFCPKNIHTGDIVITQNTYAIHYFDGSWLPARKRFIVRLQKLFGYKFVRFLAKIKKIFKRRKEK